MITQVSGGGVSLAQMAALYQPLDSDLTSIAALTTTSTGRSLLAAANAAAIRAIDGSLDASLVSAAALTVLDDATTAAMLTTLGGQPLDTDLTAIAALTSAADKMPYATGAGTWALADLSSFARTFLDDTTAAAVRTTLGIGASVTTVVQTSQISIASDATLSSTDNDTLMTATLGVGTWKVDIHGRITTGSVGGAKCDFTFGGTAAGGRQGMYNGVAIAGQQNIANAMTIATTATTGAIFTISAVITVTVSGTLMFRFCQDTSNATATVIAANNAWMDYRQIA